MARSLGFSVHSGLCLCGDGESIERERGGESFLLAGSTGLSSVLQAGMWAGGRLCGR